MCASVSVHREREYKKINGVKIKPIGKSGKKAIFELLISFL